VRFAAVRSVVGRIRLPQGGLPKRARRCQINDSCWCPFAVGCYIPTAFISMEIDVLPRGLLTRFGVSEHGQTHVSIFASTLLVIIAIPLLGRIPHFCLAEAALGIPCPGCGILSSLSRMSHLEIAQALRANPAGVVIASCFVFQLIARPIALLRPLLSGRVSMLSGVLSQVAVASLMMVWFTKLI